MSVPAQPGPGDLTLAFDLSAVEELADPGAAIADARTWSRYVGVVGNDPDAVRSYVVERGLRQDFDLGDRDKLLALERIREDTATDRYVFVGTSPRDRRLVENVGWEFIAVGEAARKAGWERGEEGGGLLARLRGWLTPGRE